MIPNRDKFAYLWAFIDATAAYVDTWEYYRRGGAYAEAEDRAAEARRKTDGTP